jgi:hypothetical protein
MKLVYTIFSKQYTVVNNATVANNDNNSNSITFDSVDNSITLTSQDQYEWVFNDRGELIGPGNVLTVNSTLSTLGKILSGGRDLADIFITHETDSQTLTYTSSSYELSISNGNTVSLSAITSYVDNNFLSLSGGTLTGNIQIVSDTSTYAPLTISAYNLDDGIGILNLVGTEPDIFFNQIGGGFNTFTFASDGEEKIAMGRRDDNSFYITRLYDNAWWDSTFAIAYETSK